MDTKTTAAKETNMSTTTTKAESITLYLNVDERLGDMAICTLSELEAFVGENPGERSGVDEHGAATVRPMVDALLAGRSTVASVVAQLQSQGELADVEVTSRSSHVVQV
jgi:hypothetical protein